ncbi:MAG: LTA synthase family protein [Bacteroides sp.]|nr:LTA synthase family protein [Bacteroides sp.]MCM1389493.1 LTA synthase family protein [Bacteroides sp.]
MNRKFNKIWILVAGCFAIFMTFDVLWSLGTTFRGMSNPALYVNAIFASFLLTLPYLLFRKVWIQGVVMFLLDILLEANLMYCRTYFTAIPADSYFLAGNLKDFTASVWDSMRWGDIALPLVTIVALWLAFRTPINKQAKPIAGTYVLLTVGAGAVSWLLSLTGGGYKSQISTMEESCYYSTCVVPVYTVFGNLIYQGSQSNSATLTDDDVAEIEGWIGEKERLRPYTSLPDSIPGRKNLVVILCESLESWVIQRDVNGTPITPYLNSLIADSTTLYAPHVLTQVAAGRSIDCQLLLNAGMLPMMQSVYSMKYPHSTYRTLTKAMKERDNDSRAYILTCDKPIVWNQEVIGKAFGIDTLLHRSSWHNDELVGNPAKLSDGSFLRQSVEKLKNGEIWKEGEPAFVQWVTYSGHNPFVLPDKLKDPEFSVPANWHEKAANYVTMAHYTDESLKPLIEYLKSRSDYDSTLIVITGDHEGLAANRGELLEDEDMKGVIDENQFTPLIILNSPVAGRYDDVMGQVDMYPTLLNLMGLDDYEWKGMGQSIFEPGKPAYAISSMTNYITGDTTGVAKDVMDNIADARKISDKIIAKDYFGNK